MTHKSICASLSRKIIINGGATNPSAAETILVYNPANMDKIGQIASCNAKDINDCVDAAELAQREWKKRKASERGSLVTACGQLLKSHAAELAAIMSYETGKALRTESMVELGVIADTFSYYGGLALELKGDTIPFDPNMLTYTIREPYGVIGAIVPWNVPLMLMAMKVAPALVAGNSVVLKASPEASFCILRAAELMNQILPKGLLNVVTGGAETGKLLVAHPKIRKITFTGSVESGRHVYKSAAEKLIPVTLELGGKSPMIICEDADLDKAVMSVYEGMRFTRQGQSCSAASRLFIHESIHDEFVAKLLAILDTKVIGDPMDDKTDIGTIISKAQYDKVQQFIKVAENDPSLTIHYGSKLPSDARLKDGLFLRPVLITGLKNSHEICQKEIFGPVAAIIKWSDFDQALKDANDVEFGLAAGIWTRDLPRALQAAQALEAGFVQVNQYIVFRPSLQFGGFKNSGIGCEGSLKAMIEGYTKEKTVIVNMG
jgi:aldehyde dehydrogenase (NAD+)